MAEASVTIPPDFLEAGRLAAIPPPIPHSCGENPTVSVQGVGYCLSLFLWCFAPSICCVCYAELRLARVVFVVFCRSRRICLLACLFLWGVVLVSF